MIFFVWQSQDSVNFNADNTSMYLQAFQFGSHIASTDSEPLVKRGAQVKLGPSHICVNPQGCSIGLERLGLETVSRRFFRRLGLVSVSQGNVSFTSLMSSVLRRRGGIQQNLGRALGKACPSV